MRHHPSLLARRVSCMSVVFALALLSQVLADTPPFEIEILPPLATPRGNLTTVVGVEMNDNGQVVGRAQESGIGVAAFRFTPGAGMLNLDPDGELRSTARHINLSGQVFGTARARDPFLYADETGYDFVPDRPTDFLAIEFNDLGQLIGITLEGRPFLYSTDGGWLDLSDVSPLFQENPTFAKLVNNAGDLVFTMNRPPGTQESFVFLNGKRLIDLGHFGFPMNVPGAIDRGGRIAGLAEKSTGPNASVASREERQSRAYYYSPRLGVVDIHPKRFKDSGAGWIQSKGKTVGGFMARRRHDELDTLFTYNPSHGLKIRAKRRNFKRFVRRRGGEFKGITITDMNDRLEFVGSVESFVGNRPGLLFATYLSRSDGGLYSLQDIVDATGLEAVVDDVLDINNKGQILIDVELPNGRGTAAILTPLAE